MCQRFALAVAHGTMSWRLVQVSVAMNQQLPRDLRAAEVVGGAAKLTFQAMAALTSRL